MKNITNKEVAGINGKYIKKERYLQLSTLASNIITILDTNNIESWELPTLMCILEDMNVKDKNKVSQCYSKL